jgi:hypothetical protein
MMAFSKTHHHHCWIPSFDLWRKHWIWEHVSKKIKKMLWKFNVRIIEKDSHKFVERQCKSLGLLRTRMFHLDHSRKLVCWSYNKFIEQGYETSAIASCQRWSILGTNDKGTLGPLRGGWVMFVHGVYLKGGHVVLGEFTLGFNYPFIWAIWVSLGIML